MVAYRSGGWEYVSAARTLADGIYDIGGLRTGSYRIQFSEDDDAYVSECYNDKPTLALADPVAVTAGATTSGINAVLAVSRPHHRDGHERERHRARRHPGDRLPLRWLRWLGGGHRRATAAAGVYHLGGLPTGSYRIQFSRSSGAYATQVYDNKLTLDLGDDVAVTAGATTSGINAVLVAVGHVTGTVTNASAAGLPDISVTAYASSNPAATTSIRSSRLCRPAPTAATTSATCRRAATASEFKDDAGVYASQTYNNKADVILGDDVVVTIGAATSGIDATLALAGTSRARSRTRAPPVSAASR